MAILFYPLFSFYKGIDARESESSRFSLGLDYVFCGPNILQDDSVTSNENF